MKIFPNLLLRIAGLDFNILDTLNSGIASGNIMKIIEKKRKILLVKNEICDCLFNLIHDINDPVAQNLLLNFKRNLFNERKITQENVIEISKFCNEDLQCKIDNFLKLRNDADNFIDSGENSFDDELSLLRNNFKTIALNEQFQKGLIVSSQSLYEQMLSYIRKDNSSLKKDDLRTEQSLIKYISRMCAKTSPFSTFTNLSISKASVINDDRSSFYPEILYTNGQSNINGKVVSHIRINNLLYLYLKALLCKVPDIYRLFLVRPNPTIKKENGEYIFLTNCNNIESFQRMPDNPALDVFLILAKNKAEGIVFGDLVNDIVKNEYIDASAEDIESFIVELIEYGFLEYNIGVSGIDPDWDIKLARKFSSFPVRSALIEELINTLIKLREFSYRFSIEPLKNRRETLKKTFDIYKNICLKLHEAAGLPEEERMAPETKKEISEEKKTNKETEEKNDEEEVFKHQANTRFNFKPEQVFLEDTSLNIESEIDTKQLRSLVSSIDNLIQLFSSLSSHLEEKEKMYYFYKQKYGLDAAIDILKFYEDYYREFKKPEAEQLKKNRIEKQEKENGENETSEKTKELKDKPDKEENKTAGNILTIPSIKDRQEKVNQWRAAFLAENEEYFSKKEDVISLKRENIQTINNKMGIVSNDNGIEASYGVFAQLFIAAGPDGKPELNCVINKLLPGFGKFYSRFLHLFPEKITEELREWNSKLQPAAILSENCDESHFNANLHPPLLPFEIWLPGSQNSLGAENQIPVTDLQIKADPQKGLLKLIHKPSNKEIYIFDMGFQSLIGRSQLFQILEKFSLSDTPNWFLLNGCINNCYNEPAEKNKKVISIRPRIVYDNKIVLQRKAWNVPGEIIPFKKPLETGWKYFVRINEWKALNNIPDKVFIYIVNGFETGPVGKVKTVKFSRDDYKPQYINFNNPFLVELFSKLINKVAVSLKIEEMLPGSDQLLKLGNNKYVGEFLIQWYKYNNEQIEQ